MSRSCLLTLKTPGSFMKNRFKRFLETSTPILFRIDPFAGDIQGICIDIRGKDLNIEKVS